MIEDAPDDGDLPSGSASTVSIIPQASTISTQFSSLWVSFTFNLLGVSVKPHLSFFEQVKLNSAGQPGNPGDKHYKCYHGLHKILMITRAMQGNLNGSCFRFN